MTQPGTDPFRPSVETLTAQLDEAVARLAGALVRETELTAALRKIEAERDDYRRSAEILAEQAAASFALKAKLAEITAMQPAAAAIREAALREALEVCAAEVDQMRKIRRGDNNANKMRRELEADGAFEILAVLAGMISIEKEVMPLDAGTTETQTQAHDIGPGDQAVAGAAPWPEGLIHLTNTRRFHVDCATEGCGRRVSTRFAGSDYCEPCGRKVAALAPKGDSHE
jgi:hypothetical protein